MLHDEESDEDDDSPALAPSSPTSALTFVVRGERYERTPLRCPLVDSPHAGSHGEKSPLLSSPSSQPSQAPLTHGAGRVSGDPSSPHPHPPPPSLFSPLPAVAYPHIQPPRGSPGRFLAPGTTGASALSAASPSPLQPNPKSSSESRTHSSGGRWRRGVERGRGYPSARLAL